MEVIAQRKEYIKVERYSDCTTFNGTEATNFVDLKILHVLFFKYSKTQFKYCLSYGLKIILFLVIYL